MNRPPPGEVPSDPDAEAAVWLARLHADDRSEADERAFRAWVAAPAHAEAFAALTAAWDMAGAVPRQPYLAAEGEARRGIGRRELVTAGVATIVAVGGLGYYQTAIAGVYETQLGEQKHVTLEDGTRLFLDTDTRLRVRYGRAERAIALERGRCNFRVAADAARPFVVEAATRRIEARAANLDVRLDGHRVQVTCIAGSASVASAGSKSVIRAGQRLVDRPSLVAAVDAPAMEEATSWQRGQLTFNDQRLADAVAEMNRYSTEKLLIEDDLTANQRVSGVYRAGDSEEFARSVAQLFPVQVASAKGEIRLSKGR